MADTSWDEPVADLAGNYSWLFRKEPDLIHFDIDDKTPKSVF